MLLALLIAACDPLAPVAAPTAVVIIVTAEPSETPTPTATPTTTPTAQPSPTRAATATATLIPCLGEGGQLLEFDDFRSEIANEVITYNVYVPPCYVETQRRYPVAYLLPGLGEEDAQWEDLPLLELLDAGITSGTLAPMLIVLPELGAVGVENEFPPEPSYETVILDELVPLIERDFCTINTREQRALGGISRGGFWAYSIALRNPDIFSIVGGHSAFFDPDNAPPANNPLELALDASALAAADLRMYLDNGASDFVGANQELFSSRLSARGIAHTYIINPVGDHNNEYWAEHTSEYLAFYARAWSTDSSMLPSCLEPSP
jgi:enterochelin esterase-like enzyme